MTLTRKEKRLRKHWLVATICCFVLVPFLLFILLAALSRSIEIPRSELFMPLRQAVFGLIPLWIIWHCAYKNHGTAYLTFSLVTGCLFLLVAIIISLVNMNVPDILEITAELAIYAWWYTLSLKLRKINKRLQITERLEKKEHPEYAESIQMLKNTSTMEDLDEKFSALMTKWPQFEPRSSKEYQSKKSELS